MALVKTISDVFDDDSRGTISLFVPEPFQLRFDEIVDELELWRHRGVRQLPEALVDYVNSETGEGGVDLIILGTCEVDLNYYQEGLVDAWERRDAEHKFKLVCIVHNAADVGWQRHIEHWSRRDAIRLLPIADHVAKSFRDKYARLADSSDPHEYTAGFEDIPIDVHVPLHDAARLNLPRRPFPRTLSRAVIQGTIDPSRRQYDRIFADLVDSIREDPQAWGYEPTPDASGAYLPDTRGPEEPFQLLLVGAGDIPIPPALTHVVSIHHDVPYRDFYALVAAADIVVPAFADLGYYDAQASSTVALAGALAVPLLATARLRRAYGYVDDARATVARPAGLPEVLALRALRTGVVRFGAGPGPDVPPRTRAGAAAMVRGGWARSAGEWAAWQAEVWARNRAVVVRVLEDAP
ncbi:uncharacterized protein BXZ73DRAFT_87432 [Epithele typhae]|uniref:uncharacterized protein n=1 Tax=Epithele typhae TaxID=378194 RepID=UPI002008E357|nr:uncharacterized protein BXZ73DRAFT_87432 [Epithele typhae]KAH9942981.1 hypothetical protein BXZ73DRAFT_87432 [Epithele typhae]